MKKQFFRKWILILAVFAPFAAMASAKMIPAEKWSITAGGNPDELIKFAAEELQELLALRIRKKIPILQSAKLPGSPVIHLGKLDKNLEHEAFSITRKGDVIFITGGTPIGTLYGVYEFLQRYCDIWSVAPGFTYAPGTPLAFGEVNITLTPAIKRRQLYHTGSVYGLRQNRIDWGNFDRRNRLPLPYADKRYRPHLPPATGNPPLSGLQVTVSTILSPRKNMQKPTRNIIPSTKAGSGIPVPMPAVSSVFPIRMWKRSYSIT